ncbi:GntR family transcriptional regulator (plasmid) [Pseudonocardia sp. EC080610-09]|uniref:GntR family transcriptional regulator n=1 Tax=unclassified Pseudonocardia TaxID=2619320 RepID=UPI00070668B7|nr:MULTISPECIES: GntR family transcriptional regulator [unclassified Pseudonocardia]ALL79827.1 GntR family transcriptional regulator [Pseudonocardia sp. EC080610-09]ALL85794.1 GntR family transcriptional regulator [Pseudonocardia sp. EC080619-01]
MGAEDRARQGNARDRVYGELRHRLLRGHYGADSALVPGTLSTEFSVSRTPVREALGLLAQDGLLVATHHGFLPHRRSPEELLEIFETRALLDAGAAEAATHRRTPLDLARLDEATARARGATDPAAVRRALNAWHEVLRSAGRNDTLAALIGRLEAQIKMHAPWRAEPSAAAFTDALDQHDAITAAVRDGDAATARARMLAHLAEDHDVRIRQLIATAHG